MSRRCVVTTAGSPNGESLASVDIPSCNPCHDGAVAHLCDGHLVSSVEAVMDSNYRYTPRSSHDLVDAFGRQDQVPDAECTGDR